MVDVVYAHKSVIIDSELSETDFTLDPATNVVSIKAQLRRKSTVGEGEIVDYYVGYENGVGVVNVEIHEIGVFLNKSITNQTFLENITSHTGGTVGMQAIPIFDNSTQVHYEIFLFETGPAGPTENLLITVLTVSQLEDINLVQNQFIATLGGAPGDLFAFDVVSRHDSAGAIVYDIFAIHRQP